MTTTEEKEAAKAAKAAEKEAAKAAKAAETGDSNDEIEVGDPLVLRPVELPLVIKLPESASKAQVAYAKTLNAYAYKNTKKWNDKKNDKTLPDGRVVKGLISKLKDLKDAPDPEEAQTEGGKVEFKNKLISQ